MVRLILGLIVIIGLLLIGLLFATPLGLFDFWGYHAGTARLTYFAITVALGGTVKVLYEYHKRSFVKKLQESSFAMCVQCGYSLKTLPCIHKCPECGAAYDLRSVASVWQRWALGEEKVS
ncbi:hypothetical protein B7486_04625 [cyanobacterium TDX16]|nr:hypothetical protein B7486_04625 [cyanobacterium TDX16]